jgi:NAD(P)-dependent dehydrogenase (short-subunit alcohol dehydrogenase family)
MDDAGEAPTPHPTTAVVTGASGGIGFEIARALVRQGVRTWIVARPSAKAEEATARLNEAAPDGDLATLAPADLSSLAEVRRLARELAFAAPRLDLLVNNAGAYVHERRLTDDGFERTWALNHLAPFLLTHLLMDELMASPQPRVITTSSNAERMGEIDLERAASGVPYSAWRAYGWSKQANIHFARELARRAPDPKLRSYAFHPGFVDTGFGSGSGWLTPLIGLAQRWFGRDVEAGADTGAWLATETPPPEPDGGFFVDREARTPSSGGRDEAMTLRLWERSETWVDLGPGERLPRREDATG